MPCRCKHVPSVLAVEYYRQHTSVPGTLAITKAIFIDTWAGGNTSVPGIWNDEQVARWKPVRFPLVSPFQDNSILVVQYIDRRAVRRNGSFIYLQL